MSRPATRMRREARKQMAFRQMVKAEERRQSLIENNKQEPPEWMQVACDYERARALWIWLTDRVVEQWSVGYFDVERERYELDVWLDSQEAK